MAVLLGGSPIKSIQKVSISGSSTGSATISAIDPDKAFVSVVGAGTKDFTYYPRVTSLTATQVTGYWGGGYQMSMYLHIVEYV